jgi:hypothetical protein
VGTDPTVAELMRRVDAIRRTQLNSVHLGEQHWAHLRDHRADLLRIGRSGPESWSESDVCLIRMTLLTVAADLGVRDASDGGLT